MPYKYQVKKGHETRVFANARNLGNGLVESDNPLISPYLSLIDEPATQAQPAVSQPQAPDQSTTSLNTQISAKEAN